MKFNKKPGGSLLNPGGQKEGVCCGAPCKGAGAVACRAFLALSILLGAAHGAALASDAPAVAPPDRPISTAKLPTPSSSYEIPASSTALNNLAAREKKAAQKAEGKKEEATPATASPHETPEAKPPAPPQSEAHAVPETQDKKEVPAEAAKGAGAASGPALPEPQGKLKIRYATLPSRTVAPVKPDPVVSAPEPLSPAEAKAKTAAKSLDEKKKKEACEAFDDYRKNQLDAIESDKRTLKALKSAVKELGLAGKLNFVKDTGTPDVEAMSKDPAQSQGAGKAKPAP